jgi:hypothetical protein
MPSMFVRGNMLSVVNADTHSVSNKGLQTGDTLVVGARKKGGWLRVRCSRTGEVISIRSGRHLCLVSKATMPASQIDLLIRENQLQSAETTIQELTESRDMWIARAEEGAEVQMENKKELESLEEQLAIAHRLLDEATKQNAELLDERSVLQEKLKKTEAEFAEWRADMGWVEVPPGSAEWRRHQAAEALVMLSNGGAPN